MKSIFIFLCLTSVALGLSEKQIHEAYLKSYQYEKVQHYSNAIKALSPVYKTYPQTYTVNLRLAWLHYLRERHADALNYYDQASKAAPNAIEPKLGRLLPLIAQKRYREAEQEAFVILKTDHYNYYANLRLAYTLRIQQKYELAEKTTLKMLTLYPLDILYLTEHALTKHGQGDTQSAIATFHSILTLDPENVTAKGYLSGG